LAGRRFWPIVQRLHDAAQAAFARITPTIILREGPYSASQPIGRLYLSERRASLTGSGGRYSISLVLRFRIVPSTAGEDHWTIQTFAYSYFLYHHDREIIAYHWDAESTGAGVVRTPHLHLGKEMPHPAMARSDRELLHTIASTHWPTGTVPFTAILRTAFRDLGVEPLRSQGESLEQARASAERSFMDAEAVLMESFIWSQGTHTGK
jgi:hypothetical protein